MSGEFEVVVTGDTIINNRVSVCQKPEFLEVVELLRGADVVQTQLETSIHEFRRAETYPAVESAWSWFRSDRFVADELRWLGIDVVSTASNHSLDYSYGGLRQTWQALDDVGIPHAGTGEDLGDARLPAFLDTPHGRIALVSAASSIPMFARAGAARADMAGRPGVNPLRYYHRVDRPTADALIEMARRLGYWVTVIDDEFAVNPPGLHNTLGRFAVSDTPGVTTVPDQDDLSGYLAAIRHGLDQADFVIAHLHTHEWDARSGLLDRSDAFVEAWAHAAVDAGAHLVVAQGSHAPIRGIEIHHGRPVFYDPGDLFVMGGRGERQPQDYYTRWGYGPEARELGAGLPEVRVARQRVNVGSLAGEPQPEGGGEGVEKSAPGRAVLASPGRGYADDPGFFIPRCTVSADFTVTHVTIHPAVWLAGHRSEAGLPAIATGQRAQEILAHLSDLCAPYGTKLRIDGDVAHIDL
jgi:poly-gamma-glutamate capsule biosynthesis protein CapA/YwtB (metallophosphatase superfamily)